MFSIPEPVTLCCRTLRQAGYEAYPVGGCVRDLLLGRVPSDWDVASSAAPQDVMGLFAKTVPTGLRHGTVTVFLGQMQLEVTAFRREFGYADGRHPDQVSFDATLIDDLSRRDFTMNAMALGPDGAIIDPFGGRYDLEQHIIRCVGRPQQRFQEDALRMLRAFRFAAQLGFLLDSEALDVIKFHPDWVRRISAERIRAELEKSILAPFPERANDLFALGLLDPFLIKRVSPDLGRLNAAETIPSARWAALCNLLTEGDAISSAKEFMQALRLERRTIRDALNYGAPCDIHGLALTGGDLYAMGLRGPAIGKAQRMLLAHVLEHPEDNNRQALFSLFQSFPEFFKIY